MKHNFTNTGLLTYSIREIFNITLCYIFLMLTIREFNNNDYLSLVYTFCLSIELDMLINRFRKFKKYYPDFGDNWLATLD